MDLCHWDSPTVSIGNRSTWILIECVEEDSTPRSKFRTFYPPSPIAHGEFCLITKYK